MFKEIDNTIPKLVDSRALFTDIEIKELPDDVLETLDTVDKYPFKNVFRISEHAPAVLVKCDKNGEPILLEHKKKRRLSKHAERLLVPTFDITIDTPGLTFAKHIEGAMIMATKTHGAGNYDIYCVLRANGIEVGLATVKKDDGLYRLLSDFT